MALQDGNTALSLSGLQTPAAAREEVVLDEDEYTDKLEQIIERDFFPDVPRLRNKLEWLQAVNSGDPLAIRNAQVNIAARRAGVPTPLGATPAAFATPAANATHAGAPGRPGSVLHTPGPFPAASTLDTPAREGGPVGGFAAEEAGGDAPAGSDTAPAVGLNAFLKNHTSEDNASFAAILAEGNKRRKEKNAWLYEDKNKKLLLMAAASNGDSEEAGRGIVSTDGYGTGNAPDGALLTWTHQPKNQLYYYKDPVAFTKKEATERNSAGVAKKILHSNTRLPSASSSSTGIFSPDSSRAATPTPARGEGAYSAVATPSMTPGADGMSPLMTWGDIESTPLRLDAEDAAEAGPSFRVPDVPSRDLLLRKLATPAVTRSRLATNRPASPLSVLRRASGAAGASPGVAKRVGTPLSAAGKKLLSQIRGPSGSATPMTPHDRGLRASYRQNGTSSLSSTPARISSARPPKARAAASRGSTPLAAPAGKRPQSVTRDTPGKGAMPTSGAGKSLTDGLLNI